MSENIQSISLGSFTLGQTNNLTFEAGPGIQISEPSEGTVRIGNDETVLWTQPRTSTANITAFTTIEKPSNFDRIRINGYVNAGRFSVEIPVDNTTDSTMRFGSCSYSPDNYGSPLQIYGISFSSNDGLNWTKVRETLRWFYQTNVSGLTGTTAATNPVIYDVIGINRISGSNA